MYRSVLVPLDGSLFAAHALPMAIRIARRTGAALDLVRVHALYALEEPESEWLPYNPAEDDKFWEEEKAYLAAIAKKVESLGVRATTAVLNGSIVESILEHAQGKQADLIVMTTHGRSPASRFWLGSVADELVRHTPHPVLLIRPQETPTELGQEPALRRILIPLDGSELAERVLEPVIDLDNSADTEYRLIRVIEEQPSIEKRRSEADAYLRAVAERLRGRFPRIETHVVVGHPAAAILEEACAQAVDLIALATHGRGGFRRLLLGSVADKIVRGTSVPVLLYRPTDGFGHTEASRGGS